MGGRRSGEPGTPMISSHPTPFAGDSIEVAIEAHRLGSACGSAGASPSQGGPPGDPVDALIKESEDRSLEDNHLRRKHPAHGVLFISGQPTIIFDTVCTKDHRPWLANEDVHTLLREVWYDSHAWLIGRYIIMPTHIHFFAQATESGIGYDNWVKYWKSQFSKRHRNRSHRWLTDHWDTRMRNVLVYQDKREYVRWNAVRHGLVENPEGWPYQGQMYELYWDTPMV